MADKWWVRCEKEEEKDHVNESVRIESQDHACGNASSDQDELFLFDDCSGCVEGLSDSRLCDDV